MYVCIYIYVYVYVYYVYMYIYIYRYLRLTSVQFSCSLSGSSTRIYCMRFQDTLHHLEIFWVYHTHIQAIKHYKTISWCLLLSFTKFRTCLVFLLKKNDAKTPKVQSGTWAPFVASGRRGVVLTSRKQGAIGPGTRFPGDATARISCTGLIVDSDPDVWRVVFPQKFLKPLLCCVLFWESKTVLNNASRSGRDFDKKHVPVWGWFKIAIISSVTYMMTSGCLDVLVLSCQITCEWWSYNNVYN